MRVIFMGTPDFAVPALVALVEAGHEVVAAYTQPPRPGGRRGKELTPSPVQREAEARQRQQLEEEAKRRADEEARVLAEEEARRQAEARERQEAERCREQETAAKAREPEREAPRTQRAELHVSSDASARFKKKKQHQASRSRRPVQVNVSTQHGFAPSNRLVIGEVSRCSCRRVKPLRLRSTSIVVLAVSHKSAVNLF